ncbi:MAG: ABC transporter ATP-binding protein [Deltaproteobacteria bacterium]|nr:ABC transporter ATP-binding protein [Deltaproteobacteria bacterium]
MLELRDITTGYGKFRVLDKISLRIDAGEIVCVVGANGAGKTTLMRAISGIIPLWQGEKVFDGKDLTKLNAAKVTREGIIQIPEGRLIIKDLSVEDNMMLGAYSIYFKMKRSELKSNMGEIYELFPILKSRARQKAGALSGGEQQMLAIARGLMGKPRLLMLDEPSLGLAPLVVKTMFDIIVTLHTKGLPILLVEQNVRAAIGISNRGYVLETGNIVMEGASEDLLNDERMVKAYMGGDSVGGGGDKEDT